MRNAEFFKELGEISAQARAAHARVDRMENVIREDLGKIYTKLDELSAHMNKGKGWGAALLFFASVAGGGIATLLSTIFSNH